jgi:hypothetical protein
MLHSDTNSATGGIDARLAALRQMLAEKFPTAEQKPGGMLRTAIASVDAVEGGLRRAALTEFSGPGGALFLHALLETLGRERCFGALVDAARTFEPGDAPSAALARLLVVFCADAMQSVKAADLLLRDGNLSLVVLDFQNVPPRQLQSIPANTWHRLQRLAEQSTAAVIILTPQPMVESAQVRIAGDSRWTLSAQRRWRHELLEATTWRVFPRRTAHHFHAENRQHATA